jgi:hypothetical protein
MTRHEPGTVARATVRGVKNVLVFRRGSTPGGPADWAYSPDPEHGLNYTCDSDVFDVVRDIRPLVVLDPKDYEQSSALAKALVEAMHAAGDKHSAANGVHPATVAVAIAALTKPPRIPEPGLWGVVEAGTREDPNKRKAFVNYPDEGWCADAVSAYSWRNLVDPVLIREGLS